MAELHLLVRLKVPDAVAASARLALAELLGHAELSALDREEYWRFEGDFSPAELQARLLIETSRFVNPAKHAHRRLESLDGLTPPRNREGEPFAALVVKHDDFAGRGALAYCRDVLGMTSLRAVEYSTLWYLWLASGDEAAARTMVECTARRRGLLANLQCERYRFLPLV